MSDKELIQQRIDELKLHISEKSSTGRTYRAINRCIEEFFNQPMGSQIYLADDPEVEDYELAHEFANKFAARMQHDFPDINFKITYPKPGVAIAIRRTSTYQELAKKRLLQWERKLKEME